MAFRMPIALIYPLAAMIASVSSQASIAGPLPPQVEKAIAKSLTACNEKIEYEAGFLDWKDVNADGSPELLIDYAKATCGGSHGYWGGSIGYPFYVFAQRGNTYTEILQTQGQNVRFETLKGKPVAILSLHPSNCPDGRQPCEAVHRWNGKAFVEAQATDGSQGPQAGNLQPWIGRWGLNAAACTAGDGITIKISKKLVDLSAFESECRIKRVEYRDGAGRIYASCSGEEGKSNKVMKFNISGDTIKFSNVDFYPDEFVRCAN